MCTRFGCNPQISFCHFFYYFELSHFWAQLLPKDIDAGKLVKATSPTIIAGSFLNFTCVFVKV